MEYATKDYIINIRVTKDTYDKVRDSAKANSESISNFIRTVITDSVDVISDFAEGLTGRKHSFKDIVSYHKAKLAKAIACGKCGATIAAGAIATIGETSSAKKYYFCPNCA
ncbi:MAG: hypothetical protein HY461_01915 [Parcubacteria group bacterium]|nr:hypothetical protein [Parcubacteria group bacterium]